MDISGLTPFKQVHVVFQFFATVFIHCDRVLKQDSMLQPFLVKKRWWRSDFLRNTGLNEKQPNDAPSEDTLSLGSEMGGKRVTSKLIVQTPRLGCQADERSPQSWGEGSAEMQAGKKKNHLGNNMIITFCDFRSGWHVPPSTWRTRSSTFW